ncbi:hypothetical protein JKY72_02090 [Candidatus Gracilibacteria bacterium]|nr:hypothetical protein [Candidatus Gracilibacteria bacterium]
MSDSSTNIEPISIPNLEYIILDITRAVAVGKGIEVISAPTSFMLGFSTILYLKVP